MQISMSKYVISDNIMQIESAIQHRATHVIIDVANNSDLLQAAANAFPRMLRVTRLEVHSQIGSNLPCIRKLPPNLVELTIRSRHRFIREPEHIFTKEFVFPPTLVKLNCSYTHIGHLPTQLPSGLRFLSIKCSNVLELPNLPIGLRYLDASYNKLRDLPDLPIGLVNCNVMGNNLTSLPKLPSMLKFLNASNNSIVILPDLPTRLRRLDASYNRLIVLPFLPIKLERLNVSNNKLVELPTLPSRLVRLIIKNNQITRLPELPNKIQYLNVRWNKLTRLPDVPWCATNSDCIYTRVNT